MSSTSPAASPVPAPVAASAAAVAQKRGWGPLAVIASAHLMAVLDTTVMFVALPSAQHALGLTVTSRQWIVTAYTLALAGLLLLGGRLADRFGARRTLVAGVAGFALASAAGGAAPDAAMLIGARAVQGAFAAVLVSSTKSLLITIYTHDDERARVMGVFTATLTAGMAGGLVLGGVLTTELGWRWCLYVNVVLSLVVLAAAPRVLPALPGRPEVRIDLVSAALASAGLAALIYGLGEASAQGWGSAPVGGSLAGAVVLLAGFAARQARLGGPGRLSHPGRLSRLGRPGRSPRPGRPATAARAPSPLLPLRIVLERNRGGGYLAMIVNALSTFGMLLILTYQLQSVMHYSPLRTGLALISFALATATGSAFLAPWLMMRARPRWLITVSVVAEAAGLLPLIWLTPHSGYLPLILAASIIEGLATGVAGPATLNITLRAVPAGDRGAASAGSSAVGQLGASIGAALLNTIAATATAGYLATHGTASAAAGTVHGFVVALAWGAVILLVAAVPIAVCINAPAPRRNR